MAGAISMLHVLATPCGGVSLAGSGAVQPLSRHSPSTGACFVAKGPSAALKSKFPHKLRPLSVVSADVAASASADVAVDEEKQAESEEDSYVPTAFEIESLLLEICDETKVAEFHLKVGSFELKMRRELPDKTVKAAAFFPPPVPSRPMIDAISSNPSPAAAAPRASVEEPEDEEEGFQVVTSPKVGFFRRGRVVKGNKGKPIFTEGMELKKGQVVGYLEQLGTQLAVESEVAGEVVKFLVEDGDPVGFGEPLAKVRPSFPGIKKLS
eukprot:TRINITY_DN2631_c0_g1_i1.p1 TRINITY_DN2631_c0_g1~~TRINITY_DN2631_c0_g1_i1.p1  ORF type:complete len:267 (+),score=64.38 TRINITY_DN2631_c0_g1_i1:106-906(+)